MEKSRKTPKNFYCEGCDYVTCRESEYIRHLSTRKHKMLTNANENANNANEKTPNNDCICECGKYFKHKSSLSRHRQKCSYINDTDVPVKEEKKDDDNLNYKEMFMSMMKKNEELQNTLIDVIPKIGNNNNNVNNFNLQIFLNENCKDAMNLMDFVNSLQLQLKDIQDTGRIGYVEGISKIMIDGLKNIDVCKRPVHCSNLTNETLYVKDNDMWDKENAKEKIVDAVHMIEKQTCSYATNLMTESPSSDDEIIKVISNVSNSTDNDKQKIIQNIATEVVIDTEDTK